MGRTGKVGLAVVALVLVAAVADNGVIGQGGGLPWRLKSDMRNFRAVTMGKPVVMGRKTYLSIGRPLPGRTNIVVSRDPGFTAPGVLVAASLDVALGAARADAQRRGAAAIMVMGGAEIYRQAMPFATRLEITQVHMKVEGDAVFPPIDPAIWQEAERHDHVAGHDDDAAYTIVTYIRA